MMKAAGHTDEYGPPLLYVASWEARIGKELGVTRRFYWHVAGETMITHS